MGGVKWLTMGYVWVLDVYSVGGSSCLGLLVCLGVLCMSLGESVFH